jgi:hypothetical protein
MFKGSIVTGPYCAGSDSVGPDYAGPDHTRTVLCIQRTKTSNHRQRAREER